MGSIWLVVSYWPGSGVTERFEGAALDREVAQAESDRLDALAIEGGRSLRHSVEEIRLLAGHASSVNGMVLVRAEHELPDCLCLEVDCADHDDFAALPKLVERNGALYGLTGWNSDRGIAYYKTGGATARAL